MNWKKSTGSRSEILLFIFSSSLFPVIFWHLFSLLPVSGVRWAHVLCSPIPCQDATRMASAGCLAELCAFLSDDELSTVLHQHLLGRWSCLQDCNRSWKQRRFLLSHWFRLTLWLNLCSVFSCAFLCSWLLIHALWYTGSTGCQLGLPRLFSLDVLSDDLIKVLAWLSNCCCWHRDSWTWQDVQARWTGGPPHLLGEHCDLRLADANCRPHLMASHGFGELTNLPLS